MITILSGQKIAENPDLRVTSPSGDYGDFDLIECESTQDGEAGSFMYQAQFVKYGGIVYRFNTPEELGAELFKLDPDSTHDAATLYREDEERRQRRLAGNLRPENPAPVENEPEPVIESENEPVIESEVPNNESASSTPEFAPEATTTPEVINPEPATTSTPEVVVEPPVPEPEVVTPPVEPEPIVEPEAVVPEETPVTEIISRVTKKRRGLARR